ncbi:MAG TPA: hypothetical protein VLY22_00635 [Candidatus Nitrosotalea sp.]|nr:hypothetical protein [Candidatus Nitrosotalea sp.]
MDMRNWRVAIAAMLVLACARAASGQEAGACKAYVTLAPVDAAVMNLLSTPAMPPATMVFAAQDTRKITQWDLPSKVTAWKDRPAAAELAREWEELNREWNGAKRGDTTKSVPPPVYRPYGLLSVAPRDWQDLEKWIGKETAKQAPGMCYDAQKATLAFLVGAVRDPTARSGDNNPTRTIGYAQTAGGQQSEGVGPGAHTTPGTGHSAVGDEFAAGGGSSDAAVYACVFVYRMQGATREAVPVSYYCHAASSLKSSVTTMLKFVAKQGLP